MELQDQRARYLNPQLRSHTILRRGRSLMFMEAILQTLLTPVNVRVLIKDSGLKLGQGDHGGIRWERSMSSSLMSDNESMDC